LLAAIRRELAPIEEAIRAHPYLDAAAEGRLSEASLCSLAGEQYAILSSDRRSFAQLAARFPGPPGGDFFLGLAAGEGEALGLLLSFAATLGLDEGALRAYEPQAGCQAYPAFVAWLALNGSQADLALAFVANLSAWGENCARLAAALRSPYGLGDAVAFFDFFSQPPSGFEERAVAVAQAGLDAGDSPARARRAARLLQAYELSFWDALYAEGQTQGQSLGQSL
jgi:thiaminase